MTDIFTKEKRSEVMRKIKGKDTSIEVSFRSLLSSHHIKYRKNTSNLPGHPDVSIKKYRLVIFLDGDFFHGKNWEEERSHLEKSDNSAFWIHKIETNMSRDERLNKQYQEMGYTVMRFWESDIRKNIDECVDKVLSFIKQKEEELSLSKNDIPKKTPLKSLLLKEMVNYSDFDETLFKGKINYLFKPNENGLDIDISNLDTESLKKVNLENIDFENVWPTPRLPRFNIVGYDDEELYLVYLIDGIKSLESKGMDDENRTKEKHMMKILGRKWIVNKKMKCPYISKYYSIFSRLTVLKTIKDYFETEGIKRNPHLIFLFLVDEKSKEEDYRKYLEGTLSKYVTLPNERIREEDFEFTYLRKNS